MQETQTAAPPMANATSESRWFFARGKERVGPFDFEGLRTLAGTGEIQPSTMLWQQGAPKWIEAETLADLFVPPIPTAVAEPDVVRVEAAGASAGQDTKTLPADFHSALRDLYRRIVLDPKECIPILAARFEARKKRLHDYWHNFVTDLQSIYERINVDPKRHLPLLAKRFGDWRAFTIRELGKYVRELPPDDPLHCKISLFGPIDFGRLETAHTRVLAWFLDPAEDHDFGPVLLHSLLNHLEGTEAGSGLEVTSVQSKPEKWLVGGKRLDVFVEGRRRDENNDLRRWAMIVEAKIGAEESENQLEAYDDWIAGNLRNCLVTRVFLTPEGRKPDSTAREDWHCLSFLELASVFRSAMPSLKGKAGYEFLRLYLTGIFKEVCRWKLPVPPDPEQHPEKCVDPYGFLYYLKSFHRQRERSPR